MISTAMQKPATFISRFDWQVYAAYAESLLEKNELYRLLLRSNPLQRLRDVSFLGALELFTSRPRSTDTRYEHTLGVAYLMLRAARLLHLSKPEEQRLVSAAILHDVGHGALSHSIEAYFKRRFAVDHKAFTKRIILGDLFIGDEISDILSAYSLDPIDLVDLINGRTHGPFAFLLQSPINVDTLDGIIRASRFFDVPYPFERPDDVLSVLVAPSEPTQRLGDHFWQLKNRIYNSYIYRMEWAIYDSMITRVLSLAQSKVTPDDFLLSDSGFKNKFRVELTQIRDRYARTRNELIFDMQNRREFAKFSKQRQFTVDSRVALRTPADLPKRYIEKRVDDVPGPSA